MKESNPLIIQLYNLDASVSDKFKKEKLFHKPFRLNGLVETEGADEINYINAIPDDVHEADFIIIDTTARKHAKHLNHIKYKINTPENAPFYNIMPWDIHSIMHQVHKTSHEQCVIFFMSNYFERKYTYRINNHFKSNDVTYNLTGLQYANNRRPPEVRKGSYFKKPSHVKHLALTNLLMKYTKNTQYKVIFPYSTSDDELLNSKSGEIVSKLMKTNCKQIFFFPDIIDKAGFLTELFTNVFASEDYGFISQHLTEFGCFKWINDYPYISHEEREIINDINTEKNRHIQCLNNLEAKLEKASQVVENVNLKCLLTAFDDELKNAVIWFLQYIDFENVIDPDEEYKKDSEKYNKARDKLLEEDIRVFTPEITYIMETKGLGGTSTDSDCMQPSKIVLRKVDADMEANNGAKTVNYKAVYIVNSQRFKEPNIRDNPPFKEQQIIDARIANRAMTTTYELFSVFHMIEIGLLSKDDVRRAFEQTGLINFKAGLIPLKCDGKFDDPEVYSFDLIQTPNTVIDEEDSIAFQDIEGNWHLAKISGIQVNHQKVSQAHSDSGGSAGVKLDKYIKSAKNFYLKKKNQ